MPTFSVGGSGTPQTYAFTSPDVLTTTDNALIPWLPGRNALISQATAQVKTAPTGAAITIAIKRYTRSTGVVIDTLGTITIPINGFVPSSDLTFTPVLLEDTQALAAEITQIGSTIAGSDLTVMVFRA